MEEVLGANDSVIDVNVQPNSRSLHMNTMNMNNSCSEPSLQPLVVLEFSSKFPSKETKDWLIGLIQSPNSGDEGLSTYWADVPPEETGNILYISASHEKLLAGAEVMALRKKCKDETLRNFERELREHFDCESTNFLTTNEKQRVIQYLLMHLRSEGPCQIPGTQVSLYQEEKILQKCLSSGIVSELYPLHTEQDLRDLTRKWYSQKHIAYQPIESIRNYFGEAIAIYFSFLGFYTKGLVIPAVVGMIYYFINTFIAPLGYMYATFAIFNLLWTTLFLEMWKRKCNAMAYHWGTYGLIKFEEARPEFIGEIKTNPVTGRSEPFYPKSKRQMTQFGVSMPVVLCFLVLAFFAMLCSFWFEDWLKQRFDVKSTIGGLVMLLPSSLYAVVIIIMNSFYRKIAVKLNDMENYRLQSEHENSLILKLVVFDFANCFMCLFYIAFYMQDMGRLKKYLGSLLIMMQFFEQFMETALPYLVLRFWRKRTEDDGSSKKDDSIVNHDDSVLSQGYTATEQGKMDVYPGTFDDYLELFLQFGYVFLFSAVYPLAAVFALANNIIEVRSDAFKLTKVCRRPFGQQGADIGTWQVTFEIMGIIAVATNVALMAMSPEVQELVKDLSTTKFILLFVAVEHIFLAIKVAIAILIPDLPDWMEEELAKEEYQSKQALLQKKAQEFKMSQEGKKTQ